MFRSSAPTIKKATVKEETNDEEAELKKYFEDL